MTGPATMRGNEAVVANGDVTIRYRVTGEGPAVVCVPGFPESASSWRHQVDHLVGRGHKVAVMDVRGYGGSSAPVDVERYRLVELASDVAAVAAAIDDGPVVLLGHDWGAPIVYATALRHPERVRAVAGMSVPYAPASGVSLVDVLDQVWATRFLYFLHFQEPGLMEATWGADVRDGLKRIYYAASGLAPGNSFLPEAPRNAPSFLALLPDPPDGPLPFLPDELLDEGATQLESTGLHGPLSRYRAIAGDVVADADLIGTSIVQPTCFIAGEHDMVRSFVPGMDLYADPGVACADFRGSTLIPGVGHWVQQEAPDAVNTALDAFLARL